MGRTKSSPRYLDAASQTTQQGETELAIFYSNSAEFSSAVALCRNSSIGEEHNDLISFLAAAQVYGIDVTPLTWLPHLESLGSGNRTEVSQSLVNAQLSLAFKRYDSQGNPYRFLLPELCILGQEPLRSHPNIVRLEGVCFETLPEHSTILPVLVLKKAVHGNLSEFMATEPGRNMNLDIRIQLLRQITEALNVLHQQHVIHGDIKPGNVLIFREGNEIITMVSDFGSSTISTSSQFERDIILPQSQPWAAPEHTFNPRSFLEAQKMDVFSLGLLGLWLLFHEEVIALSNPSKEGVESGRHSSGWPDVIAEMKQSRGNGLGKLVARLVSEITGAPKFLTDLGMHLSGMLSPSPETRVSSLEEFSVFLCREKYSDCTRGDSEKDEKPLVSPTTHHDFDILKSIHSLADAKFAVRQAVLNGLKSRAQASCSDCRGNAAYQLALCQHLGFAGEWKPIAANEWLEKSGKTSQQLQEDIDTIRGSDTTVPHHNKSLAALWNTGHLLLMDPTQQSAKQAELRNEREGCLREIETISNSLAENHAIVSTLRQSVVLASVGLHELEKAGELCHMIYSEMRQDSRYGPTHMVTWTVASALGAIRYLQGRYEDAVEIQQDIVETMVVTRGMDDLFTLSAKSDLSLTYYGQDDLAASRELLLEVENGMRNNLGVLHPTTLIIENDLASILFQQGDLEGAEAVFRRVLQSKKEVLGVGHRSTLATMGNLAVIARRRGNLIEAKNLNIQALGVRQDILPPGHLDISTNQGNLAAVLQNLGELEEAEALARKCLESTYKAVVADTADTLTSMHNLASIILDRGRLDEALEIYKDCRQKKETVLGPTHQLTLDTVSNMGILYIKMGDYQNALECHNFVVDTMTKDPRDRDPVILWSNQRHLATSYHSMGQYTRAKDMLEQTLVNLRDHTEDNPITFATLHALASVHDSLGNHEQALEYYQHALRGRESSRGPTSPLVLDTVEAIGELYGTLGRHNDAEHYCRRAYSGRLERLPEPLSDVYRSASSLSTVLLGACSGATRSYEKLAEAKLLAEQAFAGSERSLGPSNPTTIQLRWRLGRLRCIMGDKESGRQLLDDAYEQMRTCLGVGHPDCDLIQRDRENYMR
ncbi:hypothetical protein PG993_011324 [Apiospora rasikravindrae]|uniref:Protein kinase domain-containing protein n=1 Tax=Apiospora rasikravindrae TaxID=990691 RepID=A0ABR1SE16_9PEZI